MATEERRKGFAWTAPERTGLGGRTLAIPFEDVWQAALRLAGGAIRGWSVTSADDVAGEITALARSMRREHDVLITIRLDADAQTRVDARVQARRPRGDFGAAGRRLRTFFRRLDRELARPRTPHGTGGR